jgi:AmiR/NasT family two-component response regulator
LVGTTMMVDGDPRTGLFTHQTAPQIAQAQYDTQACWNARVLGEQLGHALESRSEIEQAKGIIMAITRCSADEAFLQFLRQSQRHNLKPRELAQEIVARSDRFREGEGRSRHGASR